MKEISIQHAEIFPLEIRELLRSLHESGFFSHGLLTGSWIFPLYEHAFNIRYPLKTFDIDFAVNLASLSSMVGPPTYPAPMHNIFFLKFMAYPHMLVPLFFSLIMHSPSPLSSPTLFNAGHCQRMVMCQTRAGS